MEIQAKDWVTRIEAWTKVLYNTEKKKKHINMYAHIKDGNKLSFTEQYN